jgi:hypothetical protein
MKVKISLGMLLPRDLDWQSMSQRALPVAMALVATTLPSLVQADCRQGCDSTTQSTYLGEQALQNFDPNFSVDNTAVGYLAMIGINSPLPSTDDRDTAIGSHALQFINTGTSQANNTAVGAYALQGVTGITTPENCTAIGEGALQNATWSIGAVAVGYSAMGAADGGYNNTAVGIYALANNQADGGTAVGDYALTSNTTGYGNTGIGGSALGSNQDGSNNTADGNGALASNVSGGNNTAVGFQALFLNTASDTTAIGFEALHNNTSGGNNTATGHSALYSNQTGSNNTADGNNALLNNTGNDNTAEGFQALFSNTTGIDNTANGSNALQRNLTGKFNSALGYSALFLNTNGSNNTAVGDIALRGNKTGSNNTAVGADALAVNTTGSNNIAVGFLAGASLTTGSNNIDIGNSGAAGDAATTRIGTEGAQSNTYIAGILNKPVASNPLPVLIDSSGKLGTAVGSSMRFKKDINSMDAASERILSLRPVTFHYKTDAKNTLQFGLIAEQVEKVDPELVVHGEDGRPYTVRYEAINAMLLNEFLKEHRKVAEQEATISQLKTEFQTMATRQQQQIERLANHVKKISDQLKTDQTTVVAIAK